MARRTVRGFAWLVYPDAHPPDGHYEPGRPFEGQDQPGEVLDFWPLDAEFGLQNAQSGESLLVVTAGPQPPPVRKTYKATPASLDPGFQAGGGLVRLTRVLVAREVAGGAVQECEFEADDDTPTGLV